MANVTMEDRKRRSEQMRAINEARKNERDGKKTRQEPRKSLRPDGPLRKARYTRWELEAMAARGEIILHGAPAPAVPAVIAAAYSLPERLEPKQKLQVRYDGDGRWTAGWYLKNFGKTIECAANRSSPGHRITFMGEEGGAVSAVIENYGWAQDVTVSPKHKDPGLPMQLNAPRLVQVGGGTQRRQRNGWRFDRPFATLAAAADAVMEWVETRDRAAKSGIVEGVIEEV